MQSENDSTYTTLVLANMAGMVPAMGGKTFVVTQMRMRTAIAYGVQATRKPPGGARNDASACPLCSPSTILTDDENDGVSNATFDGELTSCVSLVEIHIGITSTFVNLERTDVASIHLLVKEA